MLSKLKKWRKAYKDKKCYAGYHYWAAPVTLNFRFSVIRCSNCKASIIVPTKKRAF